MKIWYESIYGPESCIVVRELDHEYVVLRPVGAPAGPFGFLVANNREFTTLKALCWRDTKCANRYGTKHLLSGRPEWEI